MVGLLAKSLRDNVVQELGETLAGFFSPSLTCSPAFLVRSTSSGCRDLLGDSPSSSSPSPRRLVTKLGTEAEAEEEEEEAEAEASCPKEKPPDDDDGDGTEEDGVLCFHGCESQRGANFKISHHGVCYVLQSIS